MKFTPAADHSIGFNSWFTLVISCLKAVPTQANTTYKLSYNLQAFIETHHSGYLVTLVVCQMTVKFEAYSVYRVVMLLHRLTKQERKTLYCSLVPKPYLREERVWWCSGDSSSFSNIDGFLERIFYLPITLQKTQSVVQLRKSLATSAWWHSTFLTHNWPVSSIYELWIFNVAQGISWMLPECYQTISSQVGAGYKNTYTMLSIQFIDGWIVKLLFPSCVERNKCFSPPTQSGNEARSTVGLELRQTVSSSCPFLGEIKFLPSG